MPDEINVSVESKVKSADPEAIKAAVSAFERMQLYVGIPEENAGGGNGGLNNVQLAYLHSQGSPVNNIPARPFIEPAIEQKDVLEKIADQFAAAFDAAFRADIGQIRTELEKAGIYGSNAVKQYMGSGALAPNAPITVEGGWMRNKVSGKPVYIKGKHSAAPLIDTGSLRSSVTYVIKEGDE